MDRPAVNEVILPQISREFQIAARMHGLRSYNDSLSTPILATKLYIPPPRPNAVLRPRLIEQLNAGLRHKLTLISAAAGSGKTTLVSEWLADCRRPVAWLSLDEGDNDLTRFLTYLVAALQTLALNDAKGIAVHLGEGVLRALESPQPPPTEAILTALLNDITTVLHPFILVLDDYHVIDSKPIDDALALLIERLPSQMHLVIATREDPQLPLARLRVRGQLTELRAADLRFTPAEAADFLNQSMGLNLSAADIAALETRTEGWVAGLQLAALSISMRGRADVAQFVQAFAGDNRYIVDYLVEEVLLRQPERVRNFLLHTSMLDRLSCPLCDAVTGQNDGTALLDALERGNLFVVPLDDQRHWFRYHRLFADVLAAHLLQEQPTQVPILHLRASAWYAEQGLMADAIRHAFAAKDFARAADLVELALPAMRRSRQETTLRGWLMALPDALLRTRPVLSVHYVGALLISGRLEGVETRLRDAERWLNPAAEPEPSQPMVVVDEAEFRGLAGTIAIYRAAIALAQGDVASTLTHAQRALDLVPEDDHLRRGSAAGFLGLVYWTRGDLDAAHQSYAECMARLLRVEYVSDAIGCAIALADLRIGQGRLREAMRTYERGLQLATTQGEPVLRGAADMHVGMSALYRERDDLNAATQHLLRSNELGEVIGLVQNPYRWCVAMARIREAQGDLAGALDLLDEAERLYVSDYFPNVRPIAAMKTRVWLAQGRLDDALDWVNEQSLSTHDKLGYLHEFEHITLARVLLTSYKRGRAEASVLDAIGFLERLLQAAEEGARTRSIIEILVLQALAFQAHGDIGAALVPLKRALTLAEPEGYIRMFVDEGPPMAHLLEVALEAAAKHGVAPSYVRQLLTAFGKVENKTPVSHALKQALIEPLTERELEVLRLLGTNLSGPDIAGELVVSLNTVRTHIRNIYTKLGVNARPAAVRRAEDLDLL